MVVDRKLDEDGLSELEVTEDERIGEEVVEVRPLVVEVGSSVGLESVISDESGGVRESVGGGVAPVNVGVIKVVGDPVSVEGSDREDGAEGSIVIEPRELEAGTLPESVGKVNGVEASVAVGGREEGLIGVRVIVSGVPVLDGNASVAVGSVVSVSVDDRLLSRDEDKEDVDEEKSVGVCDRYVGSVSSSRVENGEPTPVKLRGSSVRRAVSGSISSSLMGGRRKPQGERRRTTYNGRCETCSGETNGT